MKLPAPVAVAGGIVLGIRLCFHDHTPKQAAVVLAFYQQATDEVGGDQLGRAGEKALGEGWRVSESRGGYGSGLDGGISISAMVTMQKWQCQRNHKISKCN